MKFLESFVPEVAFLRLNLCGIRHPGDKIQCLLSHQAIDNHLNQRSIYEFALLENVFSASLDKGRGKRIFEIYWRNGVNG